MTRPELRAVPSRLACRAGVIVTALAVVGAPVRAQTPQTFHACYVPSVGAIYLIKLTGLPDACLAATHQAFSWSESGSLADGSVTAAKLADGAVTGAKLANFLQMDNGFYLTGNAGLGTIPHEGSGVGMMWYPKKLAFRSGWVTGTQWDDANVGFGSTALGKNTTASGPFSMALGMNASTLGLEGVFVYGDASQDNTSFLVMPTAANQFVVRASGGVRFFTSPDLTVGCDIAPLGFGDLHCTGMIQSAFGGFKFPDGTIQTTAATGGGSGDITDVLSGSGLTGGGSTGSVTLSADLTSAGGDNGTGTTVARGDHVHDSRYVVEAELSASGVINDASNPVDWTKLKGVPAEIADGTDDNSGGTVTGVTAGAGLLGGTITGIGTVSVDFAGPGSANTVARSDHTHARTGSNNTGVGVAALLANTTGGGNAALGSGALFSNNTGTANTAVGSGALQTNTTGGGNSAIGTAALLRSTGNWNTALGYYGLWQATGASNIAIGADAGFNVTSGSNNIHIGHLGLSTDNGVIRIGNGNQTQAFIAGISGATSSGGAAVFVNSAGQLGTLTSSARTKEAVEDVGSLSQRLLRLRPVRFRFKPEYDDGSRLVQYGLIAEEVAEVFPELVLYRPNGDVETVRYHLLPALLLNELQRQEKELAALRAQVARLEAALRALETPGRPAK